MDSSSSSSCREDPVSILLNSADRTTGDTYSEGTIQLKRKIIGCRKVAVVSSVIPNTAYVLNGVPFVFQESAGAAPTYTLTLTGSYTGTSLALHLQTAMTAASAGGNAYVYTVLYDSDTGKMEYKEAAAQTFRILSSTAGFPAYKLGFTTTDTAYSGDFFTPNIIDLSPPKYAIVTLSGMTKSGQVITGGDREITGHFILPMGGHSFDLSEYFQKSMFDSWFRIEKNEAITSFQYRIFDAETKVLMPLQANWSIQIRVE